MTRRKPPLFIRAPFTKALFSVSLLLGLAVPCAAKADKPVLVDRIVAVVDDTTILRSDVLSRVRPFVSRLPEADRKDPAKVLELEKELLQKMIDDVLVANEAQRMRLTVNDAEIDRAIEVIANSNKISRAELEAEVKKSGLSLPDYREELRREILDAKWTQMKVRARIKPPAADAKMSDADREKALMAALETERRKALSELRDRSFVEVRW